MAPVNISKLEQIKISGDLPSPKGVALTIVRLTQREEVSLTELVHAIKADPAFVGRLIKTANGAIFGRSRPVASIQDAIQVLGVPAVRSLALGFSLVSAYRSGSCKSFNYLRFWSHSLLAAIAFQALTVKTRAAPADEAFSVGLLCRIGELALATLFPQEFSKVLDTCKLTQPSDDLCDLERKAFAMTHCELTGTMLADWGLPKFFVEPVTLYEQPDFGRFPEGSRQLQLLHSLILSRHIADICLAPDAERQGLMPELFTKGAKLSIESGELMEICNRVAADWVDWSAMLNLAVSVVPSFEELAKAHEQPADGEQVATEGEFASPLRILVVEDDAVTRAMLRAQLEDDGHEVYEALNGQQGFEMALELCPQIMIVDSAMPEMDGLELTSTLRQTKNGRGIYMLLLTAKDDDNTLVAAFEAGVDDFMPKPLRPRVLTARLRAGKRVVQMQQEIEHDREEIRRYASELAITNRRLEEVAMTDSLTRFPNRRYAMDRIRQEWSAALRSGRPLSCMVVDVDNFKSINDTYGHDIGDSMLKLVADTMRANFRSIDAVCRTGGDEFLVICPDTPLEAATLCAERARGAVERLSLNVGADKIRAGLSIGVALCDETMANIDALIKRADEGLYVAKRRGRNCVVALQTVK